MSFRVRALRRMQGVLAFAVASAQVCAAFAQESPPAPMPRVTLKDAVGRSLARNPTMQLAVQDIRRAEAIVREVRASSYPTLVGTAAYTRLDDDRRFGANVIAAKDSIAANVTLTVPLVSPRTWAQWTHAEDQVDVSRTTAADVRRTLALAVGRAYLTIIAQRRLVEVGERARDTAKAHFDFSHKRLEGGVGNRIDEVRAAQEVAADDAQLQAAKSGLVRAREALGMLLGVDGPVESGDDPELGETPRLDAGLDDASKRSDVVAYQSRLSAADRVVRDDWKDYSPSLAAIGQPFYQNPPNLIQPLWGWQAQLVLTVPFYDGGLRYGLARERDALKAQAQIQLDATVRQARSDVRASFEALHLAEDSLKSARDAATLAKQALDLAVLAYREGATTNIEVIDAERRARDAETLAAIAEDTSKQARLELLVASGRFP